MPLGPCRRAGVLVLALGACADATGPGRPTPPAASDLAAGGDFTCGVDPTRHAWCWGAGLSGQLGNGDTLPDRRPQSVQLAAAVRAIALGDYHACALTDADEAWCWGSNFTGSLGLGYTSVRESIPVPVSGGLHFAALSGGQAHTCALDLQGQAWCWGQGDFGRLGVGDTLNHDVPTAVQTSTRFIRLTAGAAHTCGLTGGGEAWCWGANFKGQLGTGDTVASDVPRKVGGGHHFTTVSAGNYHTCGLAGKGEAWCWGTNLSAELGSGAPGTDPVVLPIAVSGARRYTALSVGRDHACAVALDGATWCWGANTYGKLGDGIPLPSYEPVEVAGGLRFTRLAAASNHTCARTDTDEIYCWGHNSLGQFGDGTLRDAPTPTPSLGFRIVP